VQASDPIQEGERIMTICNSCRYCEGYCAVFPAMERRLVFTPADLNYLANLCHNCAECFYACQYAPPHEFAVNVPVVLAKIRVASYKGYAVPRVAFRTSVLWPVAALSIIAIQVLSTPGETFYSVIPHRTMALVFTAAAAFAALVLLSGLRRFWRETGEGMPSGRALTAALGNILKLEYLRSGGAGCTYPDERHSDARRWFHHATFYGFLSCFVSTSIAAFYHFVLDLQAPYGYLSLPVIFGTIGGIGLLIGPAGLFLLRRRQDPAIADSGETRLNLTLLALLFIASLSGLLLLGFRTTPAMPILLKVHLAVILAFFLTIPYGKFVHGFWRGAALVRYALEQHAGRPAWIKSK
jgi:citrate/tricarballylate utilization protein